MNLAALDGVLAYRAYPWVAIAIVGLGLFGMTWAVLADRGAAPWRLWDRYVAWLERKLRSMFVFTPGSAIAIAQVAAFVAAVAVRLAAPIPAWWLALPVIALGPPLALERMRLRRIEQIESQLDGFVLTLANALKSTPSIGDAFASVQVLVQPPLRQEVELAVKEMRLGATLDQALLHMAGRVGSRQLDSALSAILIGRQVGGNVPRILETTAGSLREMNRLEGVVRTKTAEGKAQLWVLAIFPFLIVLALDAISEGYFVPLSDSLAGYAVALAAALFWVASLVTARKVLAVDV